MISPNLYPFWMAKSLVRRCQRESLTLSGSGERSEVVTWESALVHPPAVYPTFLCPGSEIEGKKQRAPNCWTPNRVASIQHTLTLVAHFIHCLLQSQSAVAFENIGTLRCCTSTSFTPLLTPLLFPPHPITLDQSDEHNTKHTL